MRNRPSCRHGKLRTSCYMPLYTSTSKWDTFDINTAARKRKAEVEHQQNTNTFIAPTALTLADLLDQYVSIYGVNTWAPSTYEGHKSLIDNYILPLIGDVKLDDINARMMDNFF